MTICDTVSSWKKIPSVVEEIFLIHKAKGKKVLRQKTAIYLMLLVQLK